jgi:integrase/recombinase XerD
MVNLGGPITGDKLQRHVKKSEIRLYASELKLSGVTDSWLYIVKTYLLEYLNYCNWKIDKKKTLDFLQKIQKENSISTYRKKVLQIRKFLRYLDLDYLDKLKIISEPNYAPRRVTKEEIKETLKYFRLNKNFKQIKALILLGASSGLRAEELYQLQQRDIDLENRTVYVNNDSNKGQSTKTGKSRVSFFTKRARVALNDYFEEFNNRFRLDKLFGKHHLQHLFRNAPIQVKDLRKAFSQEWTRKGGNYAVKELLMGHSIKGNVDLLHYTVLTEEELKKVYDRVMR